MNGLEDARADDDSIVSRRLWLAWVAISPLLLFLDTTALALLQDVPPLVAYAVGTTQCVALPLVLRRLWIATALQFGAVATLSVTLATTSSGWPLPVSCLLVLLVHIGLVGYSTTWPRSVGIWWISVLLGILAEVLGPYGGTLEDGDTDLVLYGLFSALVLVTTMSRRQRRISRLALRRARRDMALEQAQRALVEERNRIARELHDVVAHGMSVIHMQATSAPYRFPGMDPAARAEFMAVAAGARGTLREMRQLLAVLREEDTEADREPTPGLSGLEDLAASARAGGVTVDLLVPDEVIGLDLPEASQLTAFRLVQESLSNVVRHAPGSHARVEIGLQPGELAGSIVNSAPPRRPAPIEEGTHASHGLLGMRERVRSAAGTLSTAPLPDGGYRVAFRLPLPAAGTTTAQGESA